MGAPSVRPRGHRPKPGFVSDAPQSRPCPFAPKTVDAPQRSMNTTTTDETALGTSEACFPQVCLVFAGHFQVRRARGSGRADSSFTHPICDCARK